MAMSLRLETRALSAHAPKLRRKWCPGTLLSTPRACLCAGCHNYLQQAASLLPESIFQHN
ncbi:hypothetical protein BOSEA31B_12204 [Hyphomicrobiales bacterium]|nr:hypothetical protein BOSEA31B_12204 [Hyphomicrobiales bacterium]CAH1697984.1 hypothetical protein BOSEA1005_11029 [Hyphomicrobiales bacterium]